MSYNKNIFDINENKKVKKKRKKNYIYIARIRTRMKVSSLVFQKQAQGSLRRGGTNSRV